MKTHKNLIESPMLRIPADAEPITLTVALCEKMLESKSYRKYLKKTYGEVPTADDLYAIIALQVRMARSQIKDLEDRHARLAMERGSLYGCGYASGANNNDKLVAVEA